MEEQVAVKKKRPGRPAGSKNKPKDENTSETKPEKNKRPPRPPKTVFKTGNQEFLRGLVSSYYDRQQMRIADGNRLCAHFKTKLGIDIKEENEGQDSEADDVIVRLKEEWGRLSDGFVNEYGELKSRLKPAGLFSNKAEVVMMHQYLMALKNEIQMENSFEEILESFDVYNNFLKNVKGCGTLMSACCLAYLDPHKAPTPSQFSAYAGLDVVVVERDGVLVPEGRSRKKEHLVERVIYDSEGNEIRFQSLSFNAFLKTKLVGVLAASFLKATNRSAGKDASIQQKYAGNKYALLYHNYMYRINNMPEHKDKTKAHRMRMGLRRSIKQFLDDLWKAWRLAEDLPICRTYAEEKLGIVHGHGEGDRRWTI